MARTAQELRNEARALDIVFEYKASVDDMRDVLARYYWAKENPGVEMPLQIKVMLARDASRQRGETESVFVQRFNEMFWNRNWVAELKLNGCRGILILENGKDPRMTSRRRSDQHHRYEENIENVPQFKNFDWHYDGLTVIDGELVHELDSIVTSEGTKTENQLQTAVAMVNSDSVKGIAMQKQYGNLKYWVFDILWHDGEDLRDQPYSYRRKVLEEWFLEQNHPDVELCPKYEYNPEQSFYALYQQLVSEGFEGIMLKATYGRYVSTGRPKTMYKMKRRVTYDAFITGFVPATEGKGFEQYIGAFEVSAFVDGKERVIGAISSVDLETRKDATVYDDGSKFLKNEMLSPTDKPTLNPKYLGRVMEIKGQEVSKNHRLFHCQMIEWRPDKSASDCQIRGEDFYGK